MSKGFRSVDISPLPPPPFILFLCLSFHSPSHSPLNLSLSPAVVTLNQVKYGDGMQESQATEG